MFADAEDERQQYTMVVHQVTAQPDGARRQSAGDDGAVAHRRGGRCAPTTTWSTSSSTSSPTTRRRQRWAGRAIGIGTVNAFIRRLSSSVRPPRSASSGPTLPDAAGRTARPPRIAQVTVVDLHNLPDRAQRFVVGVTLRQEFERKEAAGDRRPLLFVVLDELNKYAPREGSSPIKEILLDVAERGRSLGIILIGAQQTASEVERRIVANSAIRVVGRLDPAEAARPEYGFLPPIAAAAGHARQAGHDVRHPAGDARCRWSSSSRSRRGPPAPRRSPGRRRVEPGGSSLRTHSSICPATRHRSDKGEGRCRSCTPPTGTSASASRGSAASTSRRPVLAEIVSATEREGGPGPGRGRPVRDGDADPRGSGLVYRTLLGLRSTGADVVVIGGNHDNQAGFEALRPLLREVGITALGQVARAGGGRRG